MSGVTRNPPTADLVCLGTGDGHPCGDRNHSGYLYQWAGRHVLIDCGESVCRSLTARRFDFERLDAILLSHTHSDHLGGFFMLIQGMWLTGRRRALSVHLPSHAIGPIRDLLEHAYLFPGLLPFKLSFHPIEAGREIRVGSLRIRPHPTTHLDALARDFGDRRPVRFDAYSFELFGSGKRCAHSADIGAPEDLGPLLQKPVDLLVCELAHFPVRTLMDYLQEAKVGRLILMHLPRRLWQQRARLEKQFRSGLPGIRCKVALDGDRIRIR